MQRGLPGIRIELFTGVFGIRQIDSDSGKVALLEYCRTPIKIESLFTNLDFQRVDDGPSDITVFHRFRISLSWFLRDANNKEIK